MLCCQQLMPQPLFSTSCKQGTQAAPGHGEIGSVCQQLQRGGLRKKLCFVGTTLPREENRAHEPAQKYLCWGKTTHE